MKAELLGRGMKGWMADFGEALPFDAVTHSGLSGAALHNAYPVLWAKLNREVLEESGLLNDGTVFLRAGFTQSPKYAPMFWLGDQMTSWDEHDGIKSAVTGLLSSGLSGMSINHGDIGGLIAFRRKALGIPLINYYRTRELLLRWIELSAFTPFYRTHEGNSPEASIQIDSAPDLLEFFSKFAKIYKSLTDYRVLLFKEASARGYPVVRHLWLHYPDDPVAAGIKDQWLLGPDLLVAPVLDPATQSRRVYLPAGPWTHLWTGQSFHTSTPDPDQPAGQWIDVAAPMGHPPIFYKTGSMAGDLLVRSLKTL
jgi:alpha-glucosidase